MTQLQAHTHLTWSTSNLRESHSVTDSVRCRASRFHGASVTIQWFDGSGYTAGNGYLASIEVCPTSWSSVDAPICHPVGGGRCLEVYQTNRFTRPQRTPRPRENHKSQGNRRIAAGMETRRNRRTVGAFIDILRRTGLRCVDVTQASHAGGFDKKKEPRANHWYFGHSKS